MTQPTSPIKRFYDRRAQLAAIGYYLKKGKFGLDFFVSDSGNRIEAEDVLVADWPSWRALFRRAEAEA